MSGVVTQLGAIGKQDIETVIKPSHTFWKRNHRKHTPFAIEPKEFEFQGQTDWNKRATCTAPRTGDLLKKAYLVSRIGNLNNGAGGLSYASGAVSFTDDLARAQVDSIQVELGSVTYDTLLPEYMHSLEELTTMKERQLGFLSGKSGNPLDLIKWAKSDQYLYLEIPLFWDCENENALPLVALHLTDVKIHVRWKAKQDVVVPHTYVPTVNDAVISDCFILAEIVYLDDPERDWFADTPLKYLVNQCQFLGTNTVAAGASNARFDLQFNHPVKELIVLYRKKSLADQNIYFNFSGEETPHADAFRQLSLKLNGNDRWSPRDPYYFRVIQPKTYHTRIPEKHVYVFSFAIKPEDLEPSGSINLSRVDNVRLQMDFSAPLTEAAEVFIFAPNINVCTISNGVAILRYAS